MVTKKKSKRSAGARKAFDPLTVIKLWVYAGGRCEFSGCNEYLLVDNLTLYEANFSNIAHIVAVKKTGPRGDYPMSFVDRNNIENLMLLCRKHHKLIDDKKYIKKYTVELLQQYKREHESKILLLTDIQNGNKTVILRLRAKIAGETVAITNEHINNAIMPRYMADMTGVEIDLTSLPVGDDRAYWKTGQKKIDQTVESLYRPGIGKKQTDHLSVFAIGPIPLLIYLGSRLSNAITTDLFHFHKDIENWTWKIDGETVKYSINVVSKGKNDSGVALLLSLSGIIKKEELPDFVKNDYWIYEITLDGQKPNRLFMKKKEDLLEFRKIYRQVLSEIRDRHTGTKELLLFPAIPTPIAVACGRDLIKKADPSLLIYDFNKNRRGFRRTLKVN